jgi:hypothetical protein
MATKWYKDYRFVAPIVVALIGLIGVLAPGWHRSPPATLVVVTLDSDTGQPLAGVHLRVDEQGLSRETDSQGRSTLSVSPDLKKLRLTGSRVGYEESTLEVDLLPGGAPVHLPLKPIPGKIPPSTPPTPQILSVIVIVLDDATEARLQKARLLIDEQGIDRETDSQGRCTIAVHYDLKRLRITVAKSGYRTQNHEIDLSPGMDPVRVRLVSAKAGT